MRSIFSRCCRRRDAKYAPYFCSSVTTAQMLAARCMPRERAPLPLSASMQQVTLRADNAPLRRDIGRECQYSAAPRLSMRSAPMVSRADAQPESESMTHHRRDDAMKCQPFHQASRRATAQIISACSRSRHATLCRERAIVFEYETLRRANENGAALSSVHRLSTRVLHRRFRRRLYEMRFYRQTFSTFFCFRRAAPATYALSPRAMPRPAATPPPDAIGL